MADEETTGSASAEPTPPAQPESPIEEVVDAVEEAAPALHELFAEAESHRQQAEAIEASVNANPDRSSGLTDSLLHSNYEMRSLPRIGREGDRQVQIVKE